MKQINIYKITNLLNGKIYIGSTTQPINIRFNGHKSFARHRAKTIIHKAMASHGINNFMIEPIETVDFDKAKDREYFWINELKSWDRRFGYNLIRNPADVRFGNSTTSQQGVKKNSNKRYVGVCLHNASSEKWRAFIRDKNGKEYYRCDFLSEEEAAEHYDKLALLLYGKEARLNFPSNRENYMKEIKDGFSLPVKKQHVYPNVYYNKRDKWLYAKKINGIRYAKTGFSTPEEARDALTSLAI